MESPDFTGAGSLKVVSTPRFEVRYCKTTDCCFDQHLHPSFTITTVLSGRLEAKVGELELEASGGQSVLTNIGELHSASAEEVEFVSVGMSPDVIDEVLSQLGFVPGSTEVTFRDKLVNDDVLVSVGRSLRAEIQTRLAGRDQMLNALVQQLIIHIGRTYLSVRKSPRIELSRAGPVDRRLRRAIEFMHDNYTKELGLEEIAAAAYLSEYHFSRLFKQITGVSPTVYLTNIRIERARHLLANTRLPISEICSRVGYQSQSHFTKIFKSVTGATPRAFREGAVRTIG